MTQPTTFRRLSFLLAALVLAISGPVQAKSPDVMTYDVYAGGIHAVEASLTMDLNKSKYHVALDSATRGFLASLAPWSGVFETKGWTLGNNRRPELHRSVATWRKEVETTDYYYGRDGSFKGFKKITAGKDETPDEIDPSLTKDTTDMLTATLAEMDRLAAGKGCGGESEIFDGERRFKLTFKPAGDEVLKKTEYNVYAGPAKLCTALVEPKGGKWHKKPRGWMSIQEQGRAKGSLPTVWFAQLSKNGPAVPVKVRVKTDYGTLFMHLTSYNGQKSAGGISPVSVPAPEKRADNR